MKTAIYIEDGMQQLVLTPENQFERDALKAYFNKDIRTEIFEGSFYDCRGGWVRQKNFYPGKPNHSFGSSDDVSLIVRMASSEQQ